MSLLLLALLWIIYCFFHSFLISISFSGFLKSRFASLVFYRLIYVIFSTITIVPILVFERQIASAEVIIWSGPLVYLKYFMIAYGVTLFLLSVSNYDLLTFLGITQVMQKKELKSLAADELAIKGVHQFVRHPWYSALLSLLWARNLDNAALTTSICLSIYLYIGTLLEEKKLEITFGEKYKNYKKKVSMLFPWKWLISKAASPYYS